MRSSLSDRRPNGPIFGLLVLPPTSDSLEQCPPCSASWPPHSLSDQSCHDHHATVTGISLKYLVLLPGETFTFDLRYYHLLLIVSIETLPSILSLQAVLDLEAPEDFTGTWPFSAMFADFKRFTYHCYFS